MVNSENVTPQEEQADYNTSYEFQADPKYQEQKKDICQKRLEEWESKAGGMLVNYASAHMKNKDIILEACPHIREGTTWEADHKIKLYTVLSAHSPMPSEDIIKVEDDAVPNWEQLRSQLEARFPERGRPWCETAVKNYMYFLDLKKEHKDWNSELFSPSLMIDEVWHAHLSFIQRYQHDILAYCDGNLIEHSPVLGKKALERYTHAYRKHVQLLATKSPPEQLCDEFWPNPSTLSSSQENSHYQEVRDGDSDDCCEFPDHSSCG